MDLVGGSGRSLLETSVILYFTSHIAHTLLSLHFCQETLKRPHRSRTQEPIPTSSSGSCRRGCELKLGADDPGPPPPGTSGVDAPAGSCPLGESVAVHQDEAGVVPDAFVGTDRAPCCRRQRPSYRRPPWAGGRAPTVPRARRGCSPAPPRRSLSQEAQRARPRSHLPYAPSPFPDSLRRRSSASP